MANSLLVDDAIDIYRTLARAIDKAVIEHRCEDHMVAQLLLSSYIDSESIDEVVAIATSYSTGETSMEHLRIGTEDTYKSWFRRALREAYAGNIQKMEYAAKQVHTHIASLREEKPLDQEIAKILGMDEQRIARSNAERESEVKEFFLTSNYLLHHPQCSSRYIAGIVKEIGDSFGDVNQSAQILHSMNDLIELEVADVNRFFDAYQEINFI